MHGLHKEHRLPNVFIVEYRLVNPMTIHVVLAVRVTVILAVMILASPPTGLLLLQYCTMYVSPPTAAIPIEHWITGT